MPFGTSPPPCHPLASRGLARWFAPSEARRRGRGRSPRGGLGWGRSRVPKASPRDRPNSAGYFLASALKSSTGMRIP